MAGISTSPISFTAIDGSSLSQTMGEVSSEVTSVISLMATYHVG